MCLSVYVSVCLCVCLSVYVSDCLSLMYVGPDGEVVGSWAHNSWVQGTPLTDECCPIFFLCLPPPPSVHPTVNGYLTQLGGLKGVVGKKIGQHSSVSGVP